MKDKSEVNTEGRAVFYAVLYNRFRATALECGYSLALHGSMAKDMDLLAVPWVEDAKTPDELVSAISDCIDGTVWKDHHLFDRHEKPHGRISYTLSIMGDWQIDLSIMTSEKNGEYKMRVINETSPDMATAVGISESRRIRLSQKMDDLSKSYSGQTIRSCNMFNDILALCHNIEEVVYCVHVHTSWLFEKGYMAYAK
jgi:hypothetical protein